MGDGLVMAGVFAITAKGRKDFHAHVGGFGREPGQTGRA